MILQIFQRCLQQNLGRYQHLKLPSLSLSFFFFSPYQEYSKWTQEMLTHKKFHYSVSGITENTSFSYTQQALHCLTLLLKFSFLPSILRDLWTLTSCPCSRVSTGLCGLKLQDKRSREQPDRHRKQMGSVMWKLLSSECNGSSFYIWLHWVMRDCTEEILYPPPPERIIDLIIRENISLHKMTWQ